MRKPRRHEQNIDTTSNLQRKLTTDERNNLKDMNYAVRTRAAINALYIAKSSPKEQLERFGNVITTDVNREQVVKVLEQRLKDTAKREGMSQNLLKALVDKFQQDQLNQIKQHEEEELQLKQPEAELEEEFQRDTQAQEIFFGPTEGEKQLSDLMAELDQLEEKNIQSQILGDLSLELENTQQENKSDLGFESLDSQLKELERLASEEQQRQKINEIADEFFALGEEIEKGQVTSPLKETSAKPSSSEDQRSKVSTETAQKIHEAAETVEKISQEFLSSLEEKHDATAPEIHREPQQAEIQAEEKTSVNNDRLSDKEFAPNTKTSISRLYYASRSNEEQLKNLGNIIAPDGPDKQKFVQQYADELAKVASREVKSEQLAALIKEYKNERAAIDRSHEETNLNIEIKDVPIEPASEQPLAQSSEAKELGSSKIIDQSLADVEKIAQQHLDFLEQPQHEVQEQMGTVAKIPKEKDEAKEEKATVQIAVKAPLAYKEPFDKGTGEDALRRIIKTLESFNEKDPNFHVALLIQKGTKGDLGFDLNVLKKSPEFKTLNQETKDKIERLSDKCEKAYQSSSKIAQSFLKGQVRNMINDAKKPSGLLDSLKKEVAKIVEKHDAESEVVRAPQMK